MIRVIRDSVMLDKGMADFTAQLMTDAGLDSHAAPKDVFECLYNFVRANVHYISDNAGRVEKIKDARSTLRDGYGDCDDQTILNCTLLALVGYEPKIALAKYGGGDSDNFQHVYCVVYLGGERFVLDTTLPDGKLNQEVDPARVEEIGVFDFVPNVDDLGGIFSGVKDVFTETGKNAFTAASELSGLLPIGLIPAHLLSVGASMLGNAQETKKGTLSERGSNILGKIHDITIDLQNGRVAVETALAQARAQKARLYVFGETVQASENFKFIESQINQKIRYIETYGQTNPGAVVLDYNAMLYVGVALVGVVAFFALKDKF